MQTTSCLLLCLSIPFLNSHHEYRLCIAMSAISIWATIPLITRLFTTMKRRSGLYFYSILITSVGISVRQIGVLTVWFSPHCPWVIRRMLVEIGSMAMISGFSLVLVSSFYSSGGSDVLMCGFSIVD